LKFLGHQGNVFSPAIIDKAIAVEYETEQINRFSVKSMGIDPGFGSSKFACVITQLIDEHTVQVLYANQWERVDFNEILDELWRLICKFDPSKIWVDGANPSVITSLKIQVGDEPDYLAAIERYERAKVDYESVFRVIPVNFNQLNRQMLSHVKMLLESNMLQIHPARFQDLILSLRGAVEKGEFRLDKEKSVKSDLLDALRLSTHHYQFV